MHYTAREFSIPTLKGISEKQIDEHLKLYQGYVKHVNLIYNELMELGQDKTKNAHLMQELRRRLGFEFNGMRLHEIYFADLEGGAKLVNPDSSLYQELHAQFGAFDAWRDEFLSLSARGSGWMILNWDPIGKRFHHNWVTNHDEGQLATLPAIIALDSWEHAYMVDYSPGEKATYLNAYLDALNWESVASRFERVRGV